MDTVSSSGRAASTRGVILDAAARLFSEHGAGTTLEEVADEAGVSRQTVYLHFGSRTGLLIAMVQHIDEHGALPRLLQQVFEATTAIEALDSVVSLHAEYYPVIHPVANVFLASRRTDLAMQAAWDDRMKSRRNLYHEVVQRLNRDGLLATVWEVETATDLLWGMTSWEVWEQLVLDRGWSAEEYLIHLRTVLRRVLVEGSEPSGPRRKRTARR
jgi:AcrR family transcriptional regulator